MKALFFTLLAAPFLALLACEPDPCEPPLGLTTHTVATWTDGRGQSETGVSIWCPHPECDTLRPGSTVEAVPAAAGMAVITRVYPDPF